MSDAFDPDKLQDAQISAAALVRWLAEADVHSRPGMIDVREDHEWQAGHLPGAVHIPLHALPQHAAQIDAQRPQVIYCRAGVRSAHGITLLRDQGHNGMLLNLDGGILAWQGAGQPLTLDDTNTP